MTGRSQAVRDRTGKKTASALENRSDDALLGAGCREWTITDELVKLETKLGMKSRGAGLLQARCQMPDAREE